MSLEFTYALKAINNRCRTRVLFDSIVMCDCSVLQTTFVNAIDTNKKYDSRNQSDGKKAGLSQQDQVQLLS
jgi:hypothetical protein